jgi:putative glutamine amidotransferase
MALNPSSRPIIGILTNLLTIEEGRFAGMERLYVNRNYIDCIHEAGGLPFLIPILSDGEAIHRQIEMMDGVLLTGGQDVSPQFYNEKPYACESICLERDLHEIAVLKVADLLNKPILGVCRGIQMINVAFGGTLYQDIGAHFPTKAFEHSQKMDKNEVSHSVKIYPKTTLSRIFESETIITNSFHHQAIKELAPGFQVSARAEDGVIEGIEKGEEGSYIVGVQWHPELMVEKHPFMLKLFKDFVLKAHLTHESIIEGRTHQGARDGI